MKRLLVLALAAGLGLTACRDSTSAGLVRGQGTLNAWGGECTGTWMLEADSERNYELTNLAPEFQKSGLRVRFALKLRQDVASGCMVGAPADVVTMSKL